MVVSRRQVVQGDIFFQPVQPIHTSDCHVKAESSVIAYGEATGHAHVLEGNAELFLGLDGMPAWLRAYDDDVVVKHDTHGAAHLQAGDYHITRQKRENYEKRWAEAMQD